MSFSHVRQERSSHLTTTYNVDLFNIRTVNKPTLLNPDARSKLADSQEGIAIIWLAIAKYQTFKDLSTSFRAFTNGLVDTHGVTRLNLRQFCLQLWLLEGFF